MKVRIESIESITSHDNEKREKQLEKTTHDVVVVSRIM